MITLPISSGVSSSTSSGVSSSTSSGVSYFDDMKKVLTDNEGKYYDEFYEVEKVLTKIVFVLHGYGQIHLSTYQEDGNFRARPLLIKDGKCIQLGRHFSHFLNISECEFYKPYEFHTISLMNGGRADFYIIPLDCFLVTDYKFIFERYNYFGINPNVLGIKCLQYYDEYIEDNNLIYLATSHEMNITDGRTDKIYNELRMYIMFTDCSELTSGYMLSFGIGIKNINGKNRCVLNRVHGHCVIIEDSEHRNENSYKKREYRYFDVTLKDGVFIGDITGLEKTLNFFIRCEKYVRREPIVEYKINHCEIIGQLLRNWISTGCPPVDFKYNFRISFSELTISDIWSPGIHIFFWSRNHIEVIQDFSDIGRESTENKHDCIGNENKSISKKWIFDNGDRLFKRKRHCKINDEKKFMSDELYNEVIGLLRPVTDSLKSSTLSSCCSVSSS